MSVINSIKHRHLSKPALWAIAAMGCVSAFGTQAAIIDSGLLATPITVPNTTSGVYLNLVTNANATTPGGAPGWDFNPWGSLTAPAGMSLFWPTPATSHGGVHVASVYSNLAIGAVINATSAFQTTGGAATMTQLRAGGTVYVGIRFLNEATSAINYGFVQMSTTAPSGFPATIVRYVYGNAGEAVTVTAPGGGATPPQFAYTPAAGTTVSATGGGAVGSTGTLTITPSVGTAGSGTGAAATTTLTCTAPTGSFSGFGQTVTAVGSGAISGGPLTGSCTLGASVVTQPLVCNENRGGANNERSWTLSCPAGTLNPLTSNPASGSTISLPAQVIGSPATTATIAFTNPNASAATVTCTAPAATQFTVNPLTINVPANGNASATISYTSAAIGGFTGSLTCTSGQQTFTYTLNGTTVGQVQAVDALGNLAKLLMLLAVLGVGVVAVRRH